MNRLKKILEDAYGHVVAAESRSIPSDDQKITGHVRDAAGLLKGAIACLREIEERDRLDALAEKRIRVNEYLAGETILGCEDSLGYTGDRWDE